MVTDTQIDDQVVIVQLKVAEIQKTLNTLKKIQIVVPSVGEPFRPKNDLKYTDYVQAEIDSIFNDCITEFARIKADM